MKVKISILFIILIGVWNSSRTFSQDSVHNKQINLIHHDSTVTISIAAVGDLMCHSPQYEYAHVKADSFNFSGVYEEIKQYIESSDFAFGNLETVLAGDSIKYSGYPFFNSPDDFLSPLKNVGLKLLMTSNNHALDHGEKGLLRTIKELKKNKINYDGTFVSQRDRDSLRIFNIKGIKIAFLAYSYGTNGNKIPKDKSYLINLIDTTLIKKDIQAAKTDKADIILVYFHFGKEYDREPTQFQKEIVNTTEKYGADIIIGSHPHVIEPTEFFKTNRSRLDTGFVAFSLGNFISNQRWRYSDAGVILTLKITKNFNTDSLFISSVEYLPTWVFKGITQRGREYIILPAEDAFHDSTFAFLNKSDLHKMKQAFNDTKSTLQMYTKQLILYQPKNP